MVEFGFQGSKAGSSSAETPMLSGDVCSTIVTSPTPAPTPEPTPEPEVSLLTLAVDNIIGGDINCGSCHLTGGIASGTNFVVADLTENDLEDVLSFYIELDAPTNTQLLKDKPSAAIFHVGGNKFDGYSNEQMQWEALVDEVADTLLIDSDNIIFAEDFESYDVGSYPGDWEYFVNYQSDLSYSPSTYLGVIKVTDTDQAGGSKSLLLVNTSTQAPVQITKILDTSKFSDTVYLRLYIKQSIDLGRSPGNNHATLLGLRGETGQSEKEIRFGDAKGVLGININPTDGIAPVYEEQASQLSAAELAAAPC